MVLGSVVVVGGSSVVVLGSVVVVGGSSVVVLGSVVVAGGSSDAVRVAAVGCVRGDGETMAGAEVAVNAEDWSRGEVADSAASDNWNQAKATTIMAAASSPRKLRQAFFSLEALQPKPFFNLTAGFRWRSLRGRPPLGGAGSSRSQLLS